MSKTLTVANTGDAGLILRSLNLPVGFSADLPLPTTVPPSGSRAFTLTLNADAGGSFGGTASLLSNDAENSPFTLALSGTVTADLPPTVQITAPQEGTSVVVGSHVPVMATASDDGVVEEVDFFATDAYGGMYSLGTGFADGSGDYALDLDTARLPTGVYLLQALAYDDRWQSTTSDPVTLTVTAPAGGRQCSV